VRYNCLCVKVKRFFYFLKLLLAFPASGDIGDISAARNCQIRLSDVLVVDLIWSHHYYYDPRRQSTSDIGGGSSHLPLLPPFSCPFHLQSN